MFAFFKELEIPIFSIVFFDFLIPAVSKKTIGIPEYDDEGIKIVDLINERISQTIKKVLADDKLENKIKNAITKEINYIWGKKPFVEVIIHYN